MVGFAGSGGYVVGSLTAGLIMRYFGGLLGYGWRWLFWVQGAPGLLVGVFIFARLPNHPHSAECSLHSPLLI